MKRKRSAAPAPKAPTAGRSIQGSKKTLGSIAACDNSSQAITCGSIASRRSATITSGVQRVGGGKMATALSEWRTGGGSPDEGRNGSQASIGHNRPGWVNAAEPPRRPEVGAQGE